LPSTVAQSDADEVIGFPYQREVFYAAGLFWVFYSDGSDMVYRTSVDGVTWSEATIIRSAPLGSHFSVWFDGTYVHYTYAWTIVYYRRGVPNNDGTITWSADEQTVYSGAVDDVHRFPSLIVDSDGYAWIGVNWTDGVVRYPKVFKNSKKDGTWSTASGFPYQLTTDVSDWRVGLVPLTGGKVYVIYCGSGELPRGRLWDGGWGDEETDLANYNIDRSFGFSAVGEGDDVHFVYNRETINQIRYNKRTYGTGWMASDLLVQDSVERDTVPALSINTTTGELYCFYMLEATDHIYYSKYVGTWEPAVDWIDESVEEIQKAYFLNSWYRNYDYKTALIYTLSGLPHKLRHDYLAALSKQHYAQMMHSGL